MVRCVRSCGLRLAALGALAFLVGGCNGASGGGSDVRPDDTQPNAAVPPLQDVTIAEDYPDTNLNTNVDSCAKCRLTVMVMPVNNPYERRGLLKYDLSSLPVGSGQTIVIVSAELHLQYIGGTLPSTADEVTISAYRLNQSWSEGGVTWNNQPSRQGGSVGSVLVKGAQFNCYLPLDASVVQGWIDAPATNYGLVLVGSGGNGSDSTKAMPSREQSGKGITLDLTYTVR
jgi:hypothetical protein